MPRKTIRDININKRKIISKKSASSTNGVQKNATRSAQPKPKTKTREKTPTSKQDIAYTHSYKEHHERKSSIWVWLLPMIVIGGLIAWTLMGGARIEITPQFKSVTGDVTVTTYKQAVDDQFEYDVITLEETLSQSVTAGDAEFIEEKAQGTIVVYNEESSSQRLIEETRFETPDGLIYKLAKGKAITVPAASGETPGSLEVTVYADEPGEKYNIELTDFVIPGWREISNNKFNTQYARSKTPMSGGFSGTKRIVDDVDKERTQGVLRDSLRDRLAKEAPAQIPAAFVFFPELSNISFSTLPVTDSEHGDKVVIEEEGSLYGLLFSRAELSRLLAEEIIDGYAGEPISVTNFDELSVTAISPATISETDTSVEFSIEGTFDFEWQIENDRIERTVAGILKKNFDTAMSEFVGIHKASLKTSPVWLRSIPDKVQVEVLEVEG